MSHEIFGESLQVICLSPSGRITNFLIVAKILILISEKLFSFEWCSSVLKVLTMVSAKLIDLSRVLIGCLCAIKFGRMSSFLFKGDTLSINHSF